MPDFSDRFGPNVPLFHESAAAVVLTRTCVPDLAGSIAIAGAGISWLRDGLGIIKSAADSENVAASVKDCAGVTLVPAFR